MSASSTHSAFDSLMIFGAGGHGRVVADAALLEGSWPEVFASDRNASSCQGELLPGVQLRPVDALSSADIGVHIAIGNNRARQQEAAVCGHERLVSVIHPAATVSPFSYISKGSFVAAGAIVGPAASVGVGVIVNHGAVVDHDVEVGAFSHIAPNAVLGGHVKTGQRVLVGAGAVVLPMKIVGDDVTIGAGTVVNEDLLEPGVYAGIPVRKIQ
ncbi:MAG: NeuD/PglB/VioB family sugar acetyltransferase [Pseudomonadota bacterium]